MTEPTAGPTNRARVTRLDHAPAYTAPLHEGTATLRLQGHEAGHTERFWVGLSHYLPAGRAESAPAREETVYVVLAGELAVTTADGTETLGQHDSVHLPRGCERSIENRTNRPATLLVIIAHPLEQS
jgi:mannose-6-phosphate isomerase-like protein (cupin superfamily)